MFSCFRDTYLFSIDTARSVFSQASWCGHVGMVPKSCHASCEEQMIQHMKSAFRQRGFTAHLACKKSLGARRDKGWPREGCSWKVVESDCSKLQHSGSRKTLSSLGWWSSLADIGCRWSLEGFVEESVVLVSCGCFAAHLTNHLAHKAFTSARYPCTWINAFLVKGTAAFQGDRICRDLCPQPGDHEHLRTQATMCAWVHKVP